MRHVRPDRFARRLDGRIAILCKPLPPSAEPVLRAVVSAMGGGSQCRFSYTAIAEVASVSIPTVKRMIPLLRREGLLLAFKRDGSYLPPASPTPRAMLTLALGPVFETTQPELETPSELTLPHSTKPTRRRTQSSISDPVRVNPSSISLIPDSEPSSISLILDSPSSSISLIPAPPTQNKKELLEEGSAAAADNPEGSSPTADVVRENIRAARALLARH